MLARLPSRRAVTIDSCPVGAIAQRWPANVRTVVTAVDVMPDAVALALRNAEHLGIANDDKSKRTGLRAGLAALRHDRQQSPTRRRRSNIAEAMCALAMMGAGRGRPGAETAHIIREDEQIRSPAVGCCWSMAGLGRGVARCSAKLSGTRPAWRQ